MNKRPRCNLLLALSHIQLPVNATFMSCIAYGILCLGHLAYASEGGAAPVTRVDVLQEDLANPLSKQVPDDEPKTPNFLDKQKTFITNRIMGITTSVDRFVSRVDEDSRDENESYMVFNMESVFIEGGDHEYNINLRGRADLPNTKQRMRLIFESQPDEDFSLSDQGRSGRVDSEDVASERSIAGIEYAKKVDKDQWRPSADIGARLDFPVDTFVRVKLRRTWELGERWRVDTRINLPYFSQRGAKPSMRVETSRKISDTYLFRSMTQTKYTRRDRLQEYFQSLQINHWVTEVLSMEYKVGAFGDSEPTDSVKGYFVYAAAKRLIYKDWMYLSLIPEVNYLREDDWASTYRFTLQLQAVYSE